MFCEAYNQPLTDAAAAGEQLSPALQQHLALCDACRAAFADEQNLFAVIDAGLRIAANSEVPTTLISRVRVALNDEPAPQRGRFNFLVWGFAGSLVAAGLVLAFLYLPSKHTPVPIESARTVAVATKQDSPNRPALNSVHAGGLSPVQHKRLTVVALSQGSKADVPEVLVPPDEGAALLRYEEFLRRKQAGVVFMASAKFLDVPPGIEPLRIPEIEFVDLRIPALSKWDSEDGTK